MSASNYHSSLSALPYAHLWASGSLQTSSTRCSTCCASSSFQLVPPLQILALKPECIQLVLQIFLLIFAQCDDLRLLVEHGLEILVILLQPPELRTAPCVRRVAATLDDIAQLIQFIHVILQQSPHALKLVLKLRIPLLSRTARAAARVRASRSWHHQSAGARVRAQGQACAAS
ncbi:hypothetical protein EWM64_g4504 [Hericium alpestre]|uniref:Uncharacterized protein n=1 Tax=Hericium alpestre TaxID=135208 RepID=A0A4Y9ZZK2_9AGAM|nr:hypothetical protein EWM64_g4504 [Hericium alpestre]